MRKVIFLSKRNVINMHCIFSEAFDGVFCRKFFKNLQMMEIPKGNAG